MAQLFIINEAVVVDKHKPSDNVIVYTPDKPTVGDAILNVSSNCPGIIPDGLDQVYVYAPKVEGNATRDTGSPWQAVTEFTVRVINVGSVISNETIPLGI